MGGHLYGVDVGMTSEIAGGIALESSRRQRIRTSLTRNSRGSTTSEVFCDNAVFDADDAFAALDHALVMGDENESLPL